MTTIYPEKPAVTGIAQSVEDYRLGWEARDTALLERISKLESSQPPPEPELWTGTSRPDLAGELGAHVGVVRTYLGTGERPTGPDAGMRRAIETATFGISLSWKEAPGAWLDTLLDAIPCPVYATQNHEPYNNFSSNPAEYHRRWDAAIDIMSGHEHVVPTTILDGSRPESWPTFWRDDAEVAGVDRYNYPIDKPTMYHAPDELYGPFLDYCRGRNAPRVLIGETGSRLVSGKPESMREEHYRDCHNYLSDAGVEVAMLWLGSAGFIAPQATLGAFLNG